jgi:Fur family transcriptional regulator, peroxide stress response regulator
VTSLEKKLSSEAIERLEARGFRFTPQREQVYHVLLGERDHPTAEQVFMRAKKSMPEISMATVYNCLDFLVKCNLVKQVNLDRTAMRYCPNMHEHCHFHCDQCGGVFDIDFSAEDCDKGLKLPKGFHATGYDVSVHGECPRCSAKARN